MKLGSLGVVLAVAALGAPAGGVGGGLSAADRQAGGAGPGRHDLGRLPAGPGHQLGRSVARADGAQPEDRGRRGRLLRPAVRDHAAQGLAIRSATRRSIRSRARTSPKFYADFMGKPNAYNNGHTVREYWMEQTKGRIGMTFTPYGPYRMPRPLYEYGLNEYNQNVAVANGGGARPGTPATATWTTTSTRSGPPTDGNIRNQFDLILRLYAGYDETTVWQEFGEMKFETKEEVPDEWGPPDPALPELGHQPLRAVDLVARGRAAVGPVLDPPGRELGHDHARDRPHLRAARQQQQPVRPRRTTASARARGTSSTAARSTARAARTSAGWSR